MKAGRVKLNMDYINLDFEFEYKVFRHYYHVEKLPYLTNSPFREDNKKSLSFYVAQNHIRCKDFATGENLSLLQFLEKLFKMTFDETLQKIKSEVNFEFHTGNVEISADIFNVIKNTEPETLRRNAFCCRYEYKKGNISMTITKIKPSYKHIKYWQDYGVDVKLLNKANVYPISGYTLYKDGEKMYPINVRFGFAFKETYNGEDIYKIYQPENKEHKWYSLFGGNVISLWDMLPETGDKLVICSSLKDALCLYTQTGIPAIATQGEGYKIGNDTIKSLRKRFKKVYITFDSDEPGLKNTYRLAKETGFIPVPINFGTTKDFSDYYKSLENKEDFKSLKRYYEDGK